MVKVLALSVALSLIGCQTAPKGTFCAIASAQRPSQATIDAMTDEEITALLRHNARGGKLCGWKA